MASAQHDRGQGRNRLKVTVINTNLIGVAVGILYVMLSRSSDQGDMLGSKSGLSWDWYSSWHWIEHVPPPSLPCWRSSSGHSTQFHNSTMVTRFWPVYTIVCTLVVGNHHHRLNVGGTLMYVDCVWTWRGAPERVWARNPPILHTQLIRSTSGILWRSALKTAVAQVVSVETFSSSCEKESYTVAMLCYRFWFLNQWA